LLERHALEPIVALAPSHESAAMAEALSRLSRAGLRVGVWPLLSDAEGYWPSEDNASSFADRVGAVLAFAGAAGASIRTVAIDLEPPLSVTRVLMGGTGWQRITTLADQAAGAPRRRPARRRAAEILRGVARRLASMGIESIAAVTPMIVLDLSSGAGAWQAVLRTPVRSPGWDVVSPMMYTSAIRAALPSRSMRSARAILYHAGRLLLRSVGPRSSLSLGLVSSGKLGDEPAFATPDELEADVAAARATAIDDLALFSLEGVLSRGPPERWLDPFTRTAPRAPPRGVATAVGAGVEAASLGLSLAHRAAKVGRLLG
jgi:hypothetical protein